MADIDATGGLIATQFEKRSGHAGQAQDVCSDCGAEVSGRFCAHCGQPTHVHRTLVHLGEELLHGVMHFDGRVWRTLPMLVFRPGRLTADWVQGKRTRYVSPLAMFLFTMFVLFMGLSYLPHGPERPIDRQMEAIGELAHRTAAVGEAEEALKTAAPGARAEAEAQLAEARTDLAEAQRHAAALSPEANATSRPGARQAYVPEDKRAEVNLTTGDSRLDAKIRKKLENPDLALYKLQQAFYKFAFLLVPISIPFVALLFLWKRGFTLYDHGVFVLYSLTFMAMLVMVTAIAGRVGGVAETLVWIAVPFVAPAHMFVQLKGAYGLPTFSALWRAFLLLWFCAIALGLFVAAVVSLS